MRVSSADIVKAFQDLLAELRTREDIASWASLVRASDDAERLIYSPPAAQAAIWEALEFLMGVDLKDAPDSYLHNREDFEEYWANAKGSLVG